MSLLNVYFVPLNLVGLPSPTLPSDAVDGECLRDNGLIGELALLALLAGVASRSSQLMRLARSFVAAAASETDSITTKDIDQYTRDFSSAYSVPSASSEMPRGRTLASICSDRGRGRVLTTFGGVSIASLSFIASCPSSVASSTLTIGFSLIELAADNVGERDWTSGNTSAMGVRRRPSELCLVSLPSFLRCARASERSRRCISLTSRSPSSSHRTETTDELDDERGERLKPVALDAVDAGRKDEPLESIEPAVMVEDGRLSRFILIFMR